MENQKDKNCHLKQEPSKYPSPGEGSTESYAELTGRDPDIWSDFDQIMPAGHTNYTSLPVNSSLRNFELGKSIGGRASLVRKFNVGDQY